MIRIRTNLDPVEKWAKVLTHGQHRDASKLETKRDVFK